VESKTNPVAALKLFQADPLAFDLVITDMTMPQMTGSALAQALIRIRPDIPVILNTGYSDQIDETRAFDAGIRAYVMKPLTAMQLAKTIRSVLDPK
jgi:CheY-like chemotaxis protein